jgi:hypothetical protein
MGLSAYANLLTATGSNDAQMRTQATRFANGVRDHARVVVIGLTIAFLGIGLFAGQRLFFPASIGTPEGAIETASTIVSKQIRQPADMLYLTRMEADSDAYTITYFSPATNSDVVVRVSRKDGMVVRLTQDKRMLKP